MSTNPPTPAPGIPTWGGFLKWAGAFVILAVVAAAASESERYSEVAHAGVWLILIGATAYWFDDLVAGVKSLGP